jgi:hypothetical protein
MPCVLNGRQLGLLALGLILILICVYLCRCYIPTLPMGTDDQKTTVSRWNTVCYSASILGIVILIYVGWEIHKANGKTIIAAFPSEGSEI